MFTLRIICLSSIAYHKNLTLFRFVLKMLRILSRRISIISRSCRRTYFLCNLLRFLILTIVGIIFALALSSLVKVPSPFYLDRVIRCTWLLLPFGKLLLLLFNYICSDSSFLSFIWSFTLLLNRGTHIHVSFIGYSLSKSSNIFASSSSFWILCLSILLYRILNIFINCRLSLRKNALLCSQQWSYRIDGKVRSVSMKIYSVHPIRKKCCELILMKEIWIKYYCAINDFIDLAYLTIHGCILIQSRGTIFTDGGGYLTLWYSFKI